MTAMDSPPAVRTARLCRRNAFHVLKLAWERDAGVGFDLAGVTWLDGYIEASRPNLDRELVDEYVQLMGCFYGECLLATFGGQWEAPNGQLRVRSERLGVTYPLNAVRNQIEVGPPASVAVAYLTVVEYLAA